MIRRGLPAFNLATRGLIYFHLTLRTGERDLHSGHLRRRGAQRRPRARRDDRGARRPRRPPRRAAPARASSRRPRRSSPAGASCPPGADELAEQGARPADPRAAEEFYLRTFAEPALDVNGFESGSPHLQKTVLPVEAVANLSIRLAPGPAGRGDRARARAAAARGRPGRAPSSRSSAGRSAPPGLVAPDARGDPARARRLRAGARRPAGADPHRRDAADRAGARGQGDPDDHHRLRPARLEHPLAQRAAPRRVRAARDRRGARALPRARRALSRRARSVPGRRVVHPAPGDHRRDDLGVEVLRRGRGRGRRGRRRSPGSSLPRAALLARRARPARRVVAANACSTVSACSGCQAGRPSIAPAHAGADPGERVELLDRRVRAVGERRRPTSTQRAVGVGARRSSPPRGGRRGRGRRARARTAPSRRRRARRSAARSSGASSWACSIRWRSPSGAQSGARLLERVERLAVGAVADRVHGDREAGARAGAARSRRAPRALVIRTPEPSSISAVPEPSVPSMNTFR